MKMSGGLSLVPRGLVQNVNMYIHNFIWSLGTRLAKCTCKLQPRLQDPVTDWISGKDQRLVQCLYILARCRWLAILHRWVGWTLQNPGVARIKRVSWKACKYILHKVKKFVESPLISCSSLTFCSLGSNQISDEGAHVLSEALRVNQSLQKLEWVQLFCPSS